MLKGHVYPQLTSVRSPRTKRAAFNQSFDRLRRSDFEGEQPVATPAGILRRPSRRKLREMAILASRKIAMEQRAIDHPPLPKAEPSRILRPGGIVLPPSPAEG